MRQRLYDGCMDSKDGIEQVRQADAVCLRNEAEKVSVTIEAPWATRTQPQARFIVPVKKLIGDASQSSLCK